MYCVRVHKSNIWWSGNTSNLHEVLPEFITNIIYSFQTIHIMTNTNLSKNLYHLLRPEMTTTLFSVIFTLCSMYDIRLHLHIPVKYVYIGKSRINFTCGSRSNLCIAFIIDEVPVQHESTLYFSRFFFFIFYSSSSFPSFEFAIRNTIS